MNDSPIARALRGEIDHDTAIGAETLRQAVQRQITDNETGQVLDERRAVLVYVTPADGRRPVMEVFDAERWDGVAAQFSAACAERGIDLQVTDGRVVFA